MRQFQIVTLANGIRVAHNQVSTSKIVHCAIMLDIGSRDETKDNQGIAHFWEHMAFKGTRKRNAYHIISRLESLGGELNAFTDKEKICFYASLRDAYFERAIELLTDISFHSQFPATHIHRERKVILEEISMYHDDPEDSLQDVFDGLVFKGHPLGMNILGTEESISSFQKRDFQEFIDAHLDTSRIVISCVGDLPLDQVVRVIEMHVGHIRPKRSVKKRKKFSGYRPAAITVERPVKQARCAYGRPAYSYQDEKRGLFYMLTNILGGPGLNSRLNLALREKYGFVYQVGAQFVPFTDTGLLVISFGTEPQQLERSLKLVREELKKMVEQPLGKRQLSSAKEQLMGQIAMAEESNLGFMMMMARNLLDLGRIVTFNEIYERIRTATPESLQAMAEEMFNERAFSCVRMVPK
jgi:predicted Zn-dependent peptidase